MSGLVGNPEARFSRVAPHFKPASVFTILKLMCNEQDFVYNELA